MDNKPGTPAIQFRNVFFNYDSVPVLHDVTFTVMDGELMSIVGPNGGGKTTLLKLILGLLKPDSGTISIYGGSPEKMRRTIGYMPQYMQFDPRFPVSVRDIVLMGCLTTRPGGGYTRRHREDTRRIIEELGLADVADRPFSDLSGGQRQRVLMARALVCKPRLLLLDEPTANVDIRVETHFQEMVRALSSRLTLLIVSHDLGFVSSMVKKVICVNHTVHIHPTSDITGETIMALYGDDQRMVRHDHHLHPENHPHD